MESSAPGAYSDGMASAASVQLAPITDADVDDVATFLHRHLNPNVTAARWARAMTPPWRVDAPNHGFLLRVDGTVVGAYLAIYSQRIIEGRVEPFCNLAAWCVLEQYRFSSLRLLKALLAQGGYHFTDLSPSGGVVPLNKRLGFTSLDTATALVVNIPWPTLPGRGRITSDRATITRTLSGDDLQIYIDHAEAAAARHLLLTRGDQTCHVVFRRDRRKNLPLFANILHVSNPDLLKTMWLQIQRHFLLHHALPAALCELRVCASRPRQSFRLRSPRPKMFRSDRLTSKQIDYLYSELVTVAW